MNCPKKGLTLAITKVIKALQKIQASGLDFDTFIASVHTFSDDLQEAYLLAKAAGMSWASGSEIMQMQHKKIYALYQQFQSFVFDDKMFWQKHGDKIDCGSKNFLDYLR